MRNPLDSPMCVRWPPCKRRESNSGHVLLWYMEGKQSKTRDDGFKLWRTGHRDKVLRWWCHKASGTARRRPSLLVGDAPFPGGQHVVEGIPADAGSEETDEKGRHQLWAKREEKQKLQYLWYGNASTFLQTPALTRQKERKVCSVT